MSYKLRETEHAAIAVSVDDGPANAGVVFEVPETQQSIVEVDANGLLLAKKPGAAVVLARDVSTHNLLDAPIFVVRRSAQAIYEDEVRLGLRKRRTVFTPLP